MADKNRDDRSRTEYVCVDKEQKSISDASFPDINGALFYHVRAACKNSGIHCPPYDAGKALTCVVCSK